MVTKTGNSGRGQSKGGGGVGSRAGEEKGQVTVMTAKENSRGDEKKY